MVKSIVITGATTGIGRDAVLALASKGHHVIATGRSLAALEKVKREATDGHVDCVQLDVNNDESIASAVATIDGLTGNRGIDVLINNAGFMTPSPLAELSDQDLRAQFNTNVFGLMAVTRAFLPRMFERKAGRILNISSVSGRFPAPLVGAYHATKYAVEALSDALRMELHAFGIKVVVIEPGTIRTEFAARSHGEAMRAQRADSRYQGAFDRADQVHAAADRIAVGPACVSSAIERAATTRCPRARYVAPKRAWVAILLAALLPTWMFDGLMRQLAGLTRKQLRIVG